ncbi:sulfide:quinone oxidoreductase, mitochondrial-like protein [Sarcoptes scabiei]|uniref:Sulfide:quinone oxidoreductase, mitochondrial n=1 Tax=Sarcoptes scabiei TaxID=52283 RepID=A0A132A1A4_SARSC|nr:sulfide:quinone oxidoreductase, mitochondrial-like protein [Sarcoptes scabiei]
MNSLRSRIFSKKLPKFHQIKYQFYASKPIDIPKNSYELVVIGGGAGGLSTAARLKRYFKVIKKSPQSIAIIEPSDTHYYQPLWTLVGAGIKDLNQSRRSMSDLMPKGVDWIKESCSGIDPTNNRVTLSGASGSIQYKYLVVAAGIQIDWDKIEGLSEALKLDDSGVCSNYSAETVLKTWTTLEQFKGGHAVFTFPNTPIKCAGAPQKIMYLTDAYLTKKGIRSKTKISYHTSLPVLFGVPHYAKELRKICEARDLNLNYRSNLVRIDPKKKLAFFSNLEEPQQEPIQVPYDMLHVAPPMSAAKFLSPLSTDTSNGFVAVNPQTLQHITYRNVFALGDCSSVPTAKTAAAIASQNYILAANLMELIQYDCEPDRIGKINFPLKYLGYTSCPIVTGHNKCIMAEFDYQLNPMETFPLKQSKERRTMYYVKKDILPFIYWNGLVKLSL